MLIGRLNKTEFDRLVKEGKIVIDDIGGASEQLRFLPENFDEFNDLIDWIQRFKID